MESANFIPLGGDGPGQAIVPPAAYPDNVFHKYKKKPKPFTPAERPPKVIGKTPAERKAIAAQIRKAQRREKKQIKAEAKRQRKINDILHRRAHKNRGKYSKNKERNKLREMTFQRHQIRMNAVKQYERLAAIHDPTGKLFNVGPVITLEDGIVKPAPKPEEERQNTELNSAENIDPERLAMMRQLGFEPGQKHMSRKQQERMKKYAPKPVPPKPTRPEGIAIPVGEEDWLSMWDIDDEGIKMRLAKEKAERARLRKIESRKKKDEGEFRRAMKLMKKQALSRCENWDPEAAKKLILNAGKKDSDSDDDMDWQSDSHGEVRITLSEGGKKSKKPVTNGQHDSDTSSEGTSSSGSDSDSGSDGEEEEEPERQPSEASKKADDVLAALEASLTLTTPKKDKKAKKSSEPETNGHSKETKFKKRRSDEDSEDQPKSKKSKKSKDITESESAETNESTDKKKKKKKSKETEEVAPPTQLTPEEAGRKEAEELAAFKAARKERHELRKEKRRQRKADAEAEAARKKEKEIAKHMKKRKRIAEEAGVEEETKRKSKKSKKSAGEQWNADALEGEDARKEKFLKLLGAEKDDGSGEGKKEKKHGDKKKKKSKDGDVDMERVQNDLEKQFEAGRKHKHGGDARKGLGA